MHLCLTGLVRRRGLGGEAPGTLGYGEVDARAGYRIAVSVDDTKADGLLQLRAGRPCVRGPVQREELARNGGYEDGGPGVLGPEFDFHPDPHRAATLSRSPRRRFPGSRGGAGPGGPAPDGVGMVLPLPSFSVAVNRADSPSFRVNWVGSISMLATCCSMFGPVASEQASSPKDVRTAAMNRLSIELRLTVSVNARSPSGARRGRKKKKPPRIDLFDPLAARPTNGSGAGGVVALRPRLTTGLPLSATIHLFTLVFASIG